MQWSSGVRTAVQAGAGPAQGLSPDQRVVLAAVCRGDNVAADNFFDSAVHGGTSPSSLRVEQDQLVTQRMLLLQPVGDNCNLSCSYCYEGARRSTLAPHARMSFETLDSVLQNVLPFVSLPFSVFVHGGEPLLAGKDFFQELAQRVRSFPLGEGVTLGVQTNGTLIDKDWVSVFRKHQFQVGLSLDGPQQIHDQLRIRHEGVGSYDAVIRAIRLLQREAVPFGAISVLAAPHLTSCHVASEVLDHFIELGIKNFDVHPANSPSPGSADFNLDPDQYARLMIDLFEAWIQHGETDVRVRSIEHFFQAMAGTSANVCYRSGKCTSIMGVRPDGMAMPCTRPFDSSYTFGNLAQDSLPKLQASDGFTSFVKDEGAGRASTEPCPWAAVCGRGGCPHERASDGDQDVAGRHVYCTCATADTGGYPAVYQHYSDRVGEILTRTADALA
jgi:uncharacterized protein